MIDCWTDLAEISCNYLFEVCLIRHLYAQNGKNIFYRVYSLIVFVSICMYLIVINRSYCTLTITDIARKACCGSVPLTVFLVRALRELRLNEGALSRCV